jgi:hypothetical protein
MPNDMTLFSKELYSFKERRHLDILFVNISFVESNSVKRQLIVAADRNWDLLANTIQFLNHNDQLALKKIPLELENKHPSCHVEWYDQQNVAASRKQLQPMLVHFYESST